MIAERFIFQAVRSLLEALPPVLELMVIVELVSKVRFVQAAAPAGPVTVQVAAGGEPVAASHA